MTQILGADELLTFCLSHWRDYASETVPEGRLKLQCNCLGHFKVTVGGVLLLSTCCPHRAVDAYHNYRSLLDRT